MTRNEELINDDNGIEILVSYHYEQSPSDIIEGHGYHEIGLMIYTELKSVEVIIAGRGIDLLPLLTDKEKTFVISKLTYE